MVNRPSEQGAIAHFLRSACTQPSCLVVEGEAGMGKTTLWLAALEQAREQNFHILSAQAGQSESVFAYATVADLVGDVEPAVVDRLPDVQRTALDRVLLRSDLDGPPSNQRVVATALLSIIEDLTRTAPLLIAIDDVQWLDASSKAVVTFVTRRLKGRAGVIVTERSGRGVETTTSWLHLRRPDDVHRVRARPFGLGGLRQLFAQKLGRTFPRPTMVRLAEVSGGNPYFALELARTMDQKRPNSEVNQPINEAILPATLTEIVRMRIGQLDAAAREMLLAAACASEPTVDLLARATGKSIPQTIELLEQSEAHDIISIDGNQVRFSHPVLVRGVYSEANPSARRAMHRAMAEVETMPELKARHLALSSASTDPGALQALDEAADAARARGAPADAAELIDSAIRLGGDTPSRRLRSAAHHFQAGDNARARALLEPTIRQLPPGAQRANALKLAAQIRISDGEFAEAIDLLWKALGDAADDHASLVRILLLLSNALITTGNHDEALHHTRQAVALADEIDAPTLTSQALSMWVTVSFMCGQGVDERSLKRALETEDVDAFAVGPFRADTAHALILAWTGELAEAHAKMADIRRHCIERGAESVMMFVDLHSVWIAIWRGNFTEAARIADDAMERAEQLGGDLALAVASTVRGLAGAYLGRVEQARVDLHTAITAAKRCGAPSLKERPRAILGFLELSLSNYDDAFAIFEPLLAGSDAMPGTEIVTAGFLPDAIEAMIALGQLDAATPFIETLEHNGQWLDRPWMLAVAARCRSMWLAAHGDVAAADAKAREALREHDRISMPFERARTELLLGQLLRRQRRRDVAAAAVQEALQVFTELGAALWVERARGELERTRACAAHDFGLTPSELRVAELAAEGLTNRDVAAKLFISPKTVEHNLARAYRKLGIRSRAELGKHIGELHLDESADDLE